MVTARTTRSGGWWAVDVPEIPGLFTQAKRLEQVPAMVVDAAEALGFEVTEAEVELRPQLDNDDLKLVRVAKERRAALREAEAYAAEANREAVNQLRRDGLPVRDVAKLLEVSPQRVSQLLASR